VLKSQTMVKRLKNELSYLFEIKEYNEAFQKYERLLNTVGHNTEYEGKEALELLINMYELLNYRYKILNQFISKLKDLVYKLNEDSKISKENRDIFDHYISSLEQEYNKKVNKTHSLLTQYKNKYENLLNKNKNE
jgi:hypothetical protein